MVSRAHVDEKDMQEEEKDEEEDEEEEEEDEEEEKGNGSFSDTLAAATLEFDMHQAPGKHWM
jgi:hypothetical protein